MEYQQNFHHTQEFEVVKFISAADAKANLKQQTIKNWWLHLINFCKKFQGIIQEFNLGIGFSHEHHFVMQILQLVGGFGGMIYFAIYHFQHRLCETPFLLTAHSTFSVLNSKLGVQTNLWLKCSSSVLQLLLSLLSTI